MKTAGDKYESVKKFIKEKGKNGVVIAFSGGIDSSTLAAISQDILGGRAVAVTATSATYTPEELEEAKSIAKEIGIKLVVVQTDELLNENFVSNPENRCYYCKKELLKRLLEKADELGVESVFEGTNASDLSDHRPGFKAVKETRRVYSPWVEASFTKEEIRGIAQKLGLSVKDKPANACLASRIPFLERITREKLERISKAERIVREVTGIRQLRVRDHNDLARIEVKKEERPLICSTEIMDKVAYSLKAIGFKYVAIDAEGYRTGSMLSALKEPGAQKTKI